MPGFNRTIKTSLWEENKYFRDLSYLEKYLYIYMLTGRYSSETSVFSFPLSYQNEILHLSKKVFMTTFNSLINKNLIIFDEEEEEVLVVHYFDNHAPNGGLTYEMFKNDLSNIKSEMLIDNLVKIAKKYKISKAFYAALVDRRPELASENIISQYKFSDKNDKSLEEVRGYAKAGRTNR